MNPLPRFLRALAVTAVAASLSACISLFPKDDPSQLYRFDGAPAAQQTPAPAGEPFGVLRLGGGFAQAAAGDRLLTIDSGRVAYIANTRWVSPAVVLFGEALHRAFDANTGPARLISRGETAKADYTLRVDVTRFETVYDEGQKEAPKIVVALRVSLVGAERTVAGSKLIEAQVRAGDNRVSAIVEAYDQAVGQVLGELVQWTNNKGAA